MEGKKIQQEITFEYLDAIKYHELHDKLKEIGVGEVWSSRIKKVEVIKNAISKLASLKEIKKQNPDADEEEVQEKLDLLKAKEQEDAEEALIKQEEEYRLEQERLSKLVGKQISKEDIEKNIQILDKNLQNNVPGQRLALLLKRKTLSDLLDTMK